ncbi:uncharacterized protein LOC119094880 [Pollicipes pollicipes]|uniref:uncharacterized protein LOC119094880 n=1 Tax=Pollicipes pollicipes TaxID=41117 RepID=UPI00188559CA|nr:uncharacterized protein LOC119094880 [Pollicipes pollicipes]
MHVLAVCLLAAGVAVPAASDRFRTVMIGPSTDFPGGDSGCDVCSHGDGGGGSYRSSYQTSSHSRSTDGAGGLSPGRLGHRRTYSYSSEESEYTFTNGTHSTTITSKRSSEGVPEYHLVVTRLRDRAVLERSVLSQAEYDARRASLGLTGSAGAFGGLDARFDSSLAAGSRHDLLSEFDRRLGRRRGGGGGAVTSYSSEESYYSFSNGSHTTRISGRRNSDGVQEYHLELTRDGDGAVLDRATISEAEYNRRRQSMTGGEGFSGVFERRGGSHSSSGSRSGSGSHSSSGSRTRFDSRSRSRSDSGSHPGSGSHSGSGSRTSSGSRTHSTSSSSERRVSSADSCVCVALERCAPSGLVGWSLTTCPGSDVCCRPDGILPAPEPAAPSGSRRTFIRQEEREEQARREEVVACYCTDRSQCSVADREYSAAARRQCAADQVCCRRAPVPEPVPTFRPTFAPEPVVGAASCACVSREACGLRDRDFSAEALRRCPRPAVCCRSRGRPARPERPERPPQRPHRTDFNADIPPRDPSVVAQERDMFRDIVQHVETTDADRLQRPVTDADIQRLQGSLSRFDDAHETAGRGRTEYRLSRTRTETERRRDFGGDSHLQPLDEGAAHTVSSSRQFRGFESSSRPGPTDGTAAGGRRDDFNAGDFSQRPLDSSAGETVSSERRYSYQRTTSGSEPAPQFGDAGAASSGAHSRFDSRRTQQQAVSPDGLGQQPADDSGAHVVSSSRRYSHQRTVSGDHVGPDLGGSVTSGRGHSRFETRGVNDLVSDPDPVIDLPGPQVVSSSRRYSYQSSSSSDGASADGARLGAAGDAGRSRFESSRTEQRATSSGGLGPHPLDLSGGQTVSSSRRFSHERTVSGGGAHGGGAHGGGAGVSSFQDGRLSGHDASQGSGDLGASGHTSGSRYSSSWSSRSKSSTGSSTVQPDSYSHSYQSGPASSRSHYSSSSSRRIEQVPTSSSSYWSSYSSHSGSRRRRGLFSRSEPAQADPYNVARLDNCVCVPFFQCEDGNIVTHGADLLDIKLGPRKQCSGFRVCCELPESSRRRLQASPTLQSGVMTAVSTSGIDLFDRSHVASQPCVCVSAYLCKGGEIYPPPQTPVDMRQVSRTGRCNYDGQVCCAIPRTQILPTPPPPPCQCVSGDRCRQQDVLSRYIVATAPTCPGTQVCCSRPLPAPGGYPGSPVIPDVRQPDFDVYQFCKSYPLSIACGSTHRFSTLPTITPSAYFDADAEARKLNSAIGYFNADDEVLIEVLARRTFAERALIKNAYARLYGKDLYDAVTRTTRGKFENLMQELLEASSYYEYLAKKLHEGMDRIGTDEDVLLETLISSTGDEIDAIRPFFHAIEGKTLEADVEDDLTGDLEDIILALVNSKRDRTFRTNRKEANEQARALYQAGGSRLGTEEATFKYYLTHENYAQLALIFSEYELFAGESFEEALEDEFSRDMEDAALAIVEVTRNLPRYFAGRLHHALWGHGPLSKDDTSLRRILISRAERDLGTIAQEYQLKYGRTLIDDIEKKSTGDYEDGLVALVGGKSK